MKNLLYAAVVFLSLSSPSPVHAVDAAADIPAETVKKWFGMGTTLKPLGTNDSGRVVQQVLSMDGRVRGWAFRTDQVAPVVKGMRGEIGVLVGVGVDGRIRAVDVLSQREDHRWFIKLQGPFYKQFEKLPADGSGKPVDTVTGATVSSLAIVKDVMSACQTVLALPAVKSALVSGTHAP
jgi:hypothetical protein